MHVMESQCGGGDESLKTEAYSYNTLLTIHANNFIMESVQRAQQYLDALVNKYSHRDSTMKPYLEFYQVCAAA